MAPLHPTPRCCLRATRQAADTRQKKSAGHRAREAGLQQALPYLPDQSTAHRAPSGDRPQRREDRPSRGDGCRRSLRNPKHPGPAAMAWAWLAGTLLGVGPASRAALPRHKRRCLHSGWGDSTSHRCRLPCCCMSTVSGPWIAGATGTCQVLPESGGWQLCWELSHRSETLRARRRARHMVHHEHAGHVRGR